MQNEYLNVFKGTRLYYLIEDWFGKGSFFKLERFYSENAPSHYLIQIELELNLK